jgi:uncharacterized protein YqhQ
MRAVRVGGQALPDGVLMRTDRVWAIARADGSVRSGLVPRQRLARVPVVRVLTGLGPALLLGLRGGDRTGQRSRPWPLIRGLVLAQAVVLGANWAASRFHVGRSSPVLEVAILVGAIVAFRVATPARQWRMHGAEHKAVAAHERGIDLDDVPAVLGCSRVHPRCGTNVVIWAVLAVVWLDRLPWLWQLGGSLVAIAVAAEVMSLAARHGDAWPAKLLQAPGGLLQWLLTTSEPTAADQIIGCRALTACLERHAALAETFDHAVI